MKVGPKPSLRPFLHRVLQFITNFKVLHFSKNETKKQI